GHRHRASPGPLPLAAAELGARRLRPAQHRGAGGERAAARALAPVEPTCGVPAALSSSAMCQPADPLRGAPRDRTYVAASTLHGRGVFAAAPIAAGEVVEECPVLRFPAAQREHIDATLIDEYYFE